MQRATAVQDQQAQAWAHDALGTIFHDKAEYPAARGEFEQVLLFYQRSGDSAGEAIANELRAAQPGLLRALRAQQIRIQTSSGDVVLPEDPVFWASFVLQGAL